MTVSGLTLVMMVRNEQGRVGRALDSARPIAARWIIVDTGSTDDTVREIRDATRGWPGRLVHRPWRDFGHNRTELLRLGARSGATWLLMLDADHQLVADPGQVARLLASTSADAIQIPYTGMPQRWVSRLIKCGPSLRYAGRTHECLEAVGTFLTVARSDRPMIIDHADGASRANKWERDRVLLLQDLQEDRGNSRAWFYLGETYRGLGQFENAASAYLQCAQFSGGEEAYAARLYAGCLLAILDRTAEAIDTLHQANTGRPARREALLRLCELHNHLGDHQAVLELLGDGPVERPIPTADVEGIWPPAYDTALRAELDRAHLARSDAHRGGRPARPVHS